MSKQHPPEPDLEAGDRGMRVSEMCCDMRSRNFSETGQFPSQAARMVLKAGTIAKRMTERPRVPGWQGPTFGK